MAFTSGLNLLRARRHKPSRRSARGGIAFTLILAQAGEILETPSYHEELNVHLGFLTFLKKHRGSHFLHQNGAKRVVFAPF
jgi:hypothetical protein